jgi:hypothetical protein
MSFLTEDLRRTSIRTPSPLLKGMDAALHGIVRQLKHTGMVGEFLARAQEIDGQSSAWKDLGDTILRERLSDL